MHLLSNKIIFIDYVQSKKNIVDLQTKDLSKKLVYNSSKEMSLKPLKDESLMIVIIPSWLKISRSRFKWKTKSCNILDNTRKVSFPAYFYDKISSSWSMINDELSS